MLLAVLETTELEELAAELDKPEEALLTVALPIEFDENPLLEAPEPEPPQATKSDIELIKNSLRKCLLLINVR